MSTVFFTSDLHIGHKKVIASRTLVDGKPAFPDLDNLPEWFGDYEIESFNRILADKWDTTVGKDDVVWVLGDISSGTKSGQEMALEWLSRRPGRKRLIKGNHDGVHPMHRDKGKWAKAYGEVFEDMDTAARIRVALSGGGHVDALLSHFPYMGDHTSVDRHTQWRLPNNGTILLHGHTHSSRRMSSCGGSLQVHVGVDAWNGYPVSMDEIRSYVEIWEDV
ncbi:metallophosphoesterase [Mycobacterium phage Skinny]|uniref:Metallophosphoesterase n=1 Tax=Mycobacterium phage PegLeg TaxID=1325953 RepID=R4TNI5_9CAUD|nr:phosphoesterase [Mycobacterium phage PegLeg]AGM12357.1 metallophosphoesterase [Mycobacterium phage PegLeg]UXE05304.1 metallophosphoesterase [Mycobacterium phage Skinny]